MSNGVGRRRPDGRSNLTPNAPKIEARSRERLLKVPLNDRVRPTPASLMVKVPASLSGTIVISSLASGATSSTPVDCRCRSFSSESDALLERVRMFEYRGENERESEKLNS